jgi:glycerate-2-kinase
MDPKQTAIDIFLAGVESVKPDVLIRRSVNYENNILTINNKSIDLSGKGNLYVIGAGKASVLMAKELESILEDKITGGLIVTKYGHSVPLRYISVKEAGHPVPDQRGLKAAAEILDIARKAEEKDLILCLLSGGGSALLADLPEGCTLNDLAVLNKVLLNSGANINEMNCIRKHLSSIKGGLLSKTAWPATIISLILSDVVGDPVDVIASGPTAPDSSTYANAVEILKKYDIEAKIPSQLLQVLTDGIQKRREETLKENDKKLQRTFNFIIGSNTLALAEAKEKACQLGYKAQIITNSLEGDVHKAADFILEKIKSERYKSREKRCLLFGGEPTLNVTGKGKGGRNQHLALIMIQKIKEIKGVTFLSGGTDGTDGPTDAAGAVVDSNTSNIAGENNFNTGEYLKAFNSYEFFRKTGGHLLTGPTQTNVMDLMVALIE